VSLVTFQLAFASSVYINNGTNKNTQRLATGIAAAFAVIGFWHWGTIMEQAKELLFSHA